MNRFKKFGKGVVAAILLGSISFLSFMIYMLLVGIPKTQARNYYNAAEDILDNLIVTEQDVLKATSYLEIAINFWPEGYIQERLDEVNSQVLE